MFERKFSRPPAELARENFPTAWHASASMTEIEPRMQPQTQSPRRQGLHASAMCQDVLPRET
ncbi:MAG: hypothetical protein RL692_736 [Planctomycetota bacterium]